MWKLSVESQTLVQLSKLEIPQTSELACYNERKATKQPILNRLILPQLTPFFGHLLQDVRLESCL